MGTLSVQGELIQPDHERQSSGMQRDGKMTMLTIRQRYASGDVLICPTIVIGRSVLFF